MHLVLQPNYHTKPPDNFQFCCGFLLLLIYNLIQLLGAEGERGNIEQPKHTGK